MKIYIYIIILVALQTACDQFVEIDPPRTELIKTTVFKEASTAEAAVVDLYTTLRDGYGGGTRNSTTALGSLCSDELDLSISSVDYQAVNDNEIMPNNYIIESLWSDMYNTIFKSNAVIEGLTASDVETAVKNKLIGEALFIRAYTYFYLINFWGDVPLITSTDYIENNGQLRSPTAEIYEQIVEDLLTSKSLLGTEYHGSRTRANRHVAEAFLARVYLYRQEWEKAETEATKVIDSELYTLETDPSHVFRTSSGEAILQLWHFQYPNQYATFLISPTRGPRFATLNPGFLKSFDPNDLRYISWILQQDFAGTTFYGLFKYKSIAIPPDDYSTILRLAEQYLIRSEARAHQDNFPGAMADLNEIRARAQIAPTTASTKQELLEAIYLERKHELFGEEAHRWLDLKRLKMANEVLQPIKPNWTGTDLLYPIPEAQLKNNPFFTQNPAGS